MLRADLEEAPPAPAPLEAPQQSVDEVETNMLSDFTQRMAARGTESNVRDAAQEYVDSVKSNVQVEQSGPSIVYVAGQAALLLLLLVGDVPVVGGVIETLLGPGLVAAGLGAIAKGGSRPIVEVVDYAEAPSKRGLVIMNTPSAACESMTGLLGGGSHMIIFSTGRGNAIGAPVSPTVKITGNPHTAATMKENIDVDVSAIISEGKALETAADRLWNEMLKVAQGKITRCEVLKEDQLSVSRFGPSV